MLASRQPQRPHRPSGDLRELPRDASRQCRLPEQRDPPNWGSNSTYGGGDGSFNIVNNYKPGPASKEKKYFVDATGITPIRMWFAIPALYVRELPCRKLCTAINADNWAGVYFHPQATILDHGRASSAPLPIKAGDDGLLYHDAYGRRGFRSVVTYAGASLSRVMPTNGPRPTPAAAKRHSRTAATARRAV